MDLQFGERTVVIEGILLRVAHCPRPRHEVACERSKMPPVRDLVKRGLGLNGLRGATHNSTGSSLYSTSVIHKKLPQRLKG